MLPETPEEIEAREERLRSARKRNPKPPADESDEAKRERLEAELDQVLADERAEAERVRALGPEPTPEITSAQLADNPSNYIPGIEENRRRALEAQEAPDEHEALVAQARHAMLDEERGGVVTAAAKPAVPTPKVEREDTRQLWVCVGADGIRTMTNGTLHPVFRSDAHLIGEMVACPQCGQTSVRKVQPDEDLHLDEERAIWQSMAPHQRDAVMAQRRAALTMQR